MRIILPSFASLSSLRISDSSEEDSDICLEVSFFETILDFLLVGRSHSDSEEEDVDAESLERSCLTTFFGLIFFLLFINFNFNLGCEFEDGLARGFWFVLAEIFLEDVSVEAEVFLLNNLFLFIKSSSMHFGHFQV